MAKLSLSGSWTGVYDYPVASMDPVPFSAELTDIAGVVWGEICEPRSGAFGGTSAELTSTIMGHRSARELQFEKRYDPVIEGGESAIHYAGIISADCNRIEGKWSINDGFDGFSGPFVMDRVRGVEAEKSTKAEAALELTARSDGRGFSAKREQPHLVVIDQDMGLFDLLRRHFLDHLFLRDRGIGIAANGGQHVPHIGAGQIGGGHAKAELVIPANPALRAGMALHRRAQIPFKRPLRVLLDAKAKGIHHANQLLSICIARACRRPEFGAGLFKAARFHQIAGMFDFRARKAGQKAKKKSKCSHVSLVVSCLFGLSGAIAQAGDLGPEDFGPIDTKKAAIGQLLFYDPILSGNRNISCGTCHNHDHASTDGIALGLGEGGVGVGPKRKPGSGDSRVLRRTARNAPALFNLGAKDISVLFHDGRISRSDLYDNGFNSPAEERLPDGLDSLLAVQAVFPLVSQREMAGDPRENEVAGASNDRIDAGWPILSKRVRGIPEYGAAFVEAFDDVNAPSEVRIQHIANALAAFIDAEWRSFDAPYDRGELSAAAMRGHALFEEEAGCATCHSGPLFTDQKFYALALPQFGPGRARQFDPHVRDVGRMGESDDLADAYRFRTPSLRNVALTGPYGHNGAYPTLEGIIRHHLDPLGAYWSPEMVKMPRVAWLEDVDFVIQSDARELARQRRAVDIEPMDLSDAQVADLIAFLEALTGDTAMTGRLGKPKSVPSGLKVD